MEMRNINQIKIYGLVLNTFGNAEDGELVAVATSEKALRDFYELQKLEKMENINGWNYSFKEGVLRENNPLHGGWHHINEDSFGHGWFEEWVDESKIRSDIYRVDF